MTRLPSLRKSFLAIDLRVFCGVVAAHGIGLLMIMISPLIIGGLIMDTANGGFGIGEATAGAVITCELFAVGISTYAVAPFVNRIPLRRAALAGALLCSLANFLSLLLATGDVTGLAVTRILSGAGAGVVFATGSATVARSRDPDRVYALMVLTGTLLSAAALLAVPFAVSAFGYRGGFLFVAVNVAILIPFLLLLPRQSADEDPELASGAGKFDWYGNRATIAAIMAGTLLLTVGDGQMYYYSEVIGLASGITLKGVGIVLAASTFVGLAGGATAAAVDLRFGRTRPLAISLMVKAVGCFALVCIASMYTYTVLQCMLGFTFYFALPYILGLSARIDTKGRIAALAGGSIQFGAALSAFTGGVIVEQMGLLALGSISAAMIVLTFVVLVPGALRYDRGGETRTLQVASQGP
jgi:predicted MFS family arabinose efflux permease